MKTWKNLYPKICSFENLLVASRKARKGKRYRRNVYLFERDLENNLFVLQDELLSGSWRPGTYRRFYVQEAKRRLISAAPYRDRIVHHALCNVIEPLFDRTFIYDSYACRKGKGTHAAADRYTEFSRIARYVLKCDISRYFDNIRHDILFGELERKIADRDVLNLCEKIIRSHGDEGLLWPSGRGIPIGNQTSQFFSNLYLNRFDHWIKEELRTRYFIRYVDDFVILDNSKKKLHSLIPVIEERLNTIALKLHPKKRSVFPVTEGCDFMGYRIWPHHRRLRPSNGYRFQRKLKKMSSLYRQGRLDFESINSSIMSWIGHASHADSYGLRKAMFRKVVFSKG